MSIDKKLLFGAWLHSNEEDTPGKTNYRREEHSFPPSRGGRTGFVFHEDGSVDKIIPGPADKRLHVNGSWTVEKNGMLKISIPGDDDKLLQVISLDNNRMIIKK